MYEQKAAHIDPDGGGLFVNALHRGVLGAVEAVHVDVRVRERHKAFQRDQQHAQSLLTAVHQLGVHTAAYSTHRLNIHSLFLNQFLKKSDLKKKMMMMMMMSISILHGSIDLNAWCAEGDVLFFEMKNYTEKALGRHREVTVHSESNNTEKEKSTGKQVSF